MFYNYLMDFLSKIMNALSSPNPVSINKTQQ